MLYRQPSYYKKIKTIALALISSLIFLLNGFAQKISYRLENISRENGLSSQSVFSIHQDKKGFMWFGTYNGLNRYDGTNVKVYYFDADTDSTTNKIDYNYINCIIEDDNGFFWMGTIGGGIIVFNSKTNNYKRFSNFFINNPIFSLCFDKNENIWAGTKRGLYKISINDEILSISDLDNIPISFIHYKHLLNQQEGDIKNQISCIISSHDNKLWIGGDQGGGLTLFDTKSGNFTNYTKSEESKETGQQIVYNAKGLSSNNVSSLFEEKDGNIWCGTIDKGVCLFKRKTNSFIQYDLKDRFYPNLANQILSVIRDDNEILWIGTNRNSLIGSHGYNENIFDSIFIVSFNLERKNALPDNVIRKIYQGKSGELWLATRRKGVAKLEHSDYNISHIKTSDKAKRDNRVNTVIKDEKGNIWSGRDGQGIKLIIPDKNGYKNYRIGNNRDKKKSIITIFKDSRGIIWVGDYGDGALFQVKYDEKKPENSTLVPFPKESLSVELSEIEYVHKIFEDSKKRIWLGSDFGLFRLTYKEGEIICRTFRRDIENPLNSVIGNLIFDICEDGNNNIWAATYSGLTCLKIDEENDSVEFQHYLHKLKDGQDYDRDIIQSIKAYKDSLLWVGTRSGIRCINIETNEISSYYSSDGIPDNFIAFVVLNKNHNLWVGSLKSGISLFNTKSRKGKIIPLTNDIFANRMELNAFFLDKDENLYAGTGNGILKISPNKYAQKMVLPQPVITQLFLAGKSVKEGDNKKAILRKEISYTDYIELNHKEKYIGFEFSSLNFSSQKNIQYKYMLEGVDDGWNITNYDRNFASYSNLSPGDYRFILKASNNDGFWNETPTTIAIKINLPFWKEWWAYIIYSCIIILIVLISKQEITRRVRLIEEVKYERKEKERVSELNQLKSRFFTNITHEVRTPLSLIIDPLEEVLKDKEIKSKSRSTLKLISQNSKRLLGLINELIDFRKVETGQVKLSIKQGDIVGFVKKIKEYFQYFAVSQNIDYTFYSDEEQINGLFDNNILEKVLNNLLSNAFKFTPKDGKISVLISKCSEIKKDQKKKKQLLENEEEYNCVKITVEDNGIGISKENLNNIFKRFYQIESKNMDAMMGSGIGLSLTKELLEIHGGKIKVKSEEGSGTKFSIKLPITKAALKEFYNFDDREIESLQEPKTKEKEVFIASETDIDTDKQIDKESKPLILVVDDYDDIRIYLRDSLEYNYRVIEATNGKDGFEKTKEHIPDLIISDLMMPVLDGLKFCKLVKTNFETSHIPFILLTAKISEEDAIDGLEIGADDYIAKPFNAQILKLMIKNRLRTRRQYHEQFMKDINLSPREITNTKIDSEFLEKAIDVVKSNMENPNFSVNELMHEMAVSRAGLHRKLKELTALSTTSFIRTVKLKQAATLLKSSDLNISEIAYRVGFTNPKYFSKRFKEFFGKFPSEYK